MGSRLRCLRLSDFPSPLLFLLLLQPVLFVLKSLKLIVVASIAPVCPQVDLGEGHMAIGIVLGTQALTFLAQDLIVFILLLVIEQDVVGDSP